MNLRKKEDYHNKIVLFSVARQTISQKKKGYYLELSHKHVHVLEVYFSFENNLIRVAMCGSESSHAPYAYVEFYM
jgi:hypothetical protein